LVTRLAIGPGSEVNRAGSAVSQQALDAVGSSVRAYPRIRCIRRVARTGGGAFVACQQGADFSYELCIALAPRLQLREAFVRGNLQRAVEEFLRVANGMPAA
jgi:hypothetical protein